MSKNFPDDSGGQPALKTRTVSFRFLLLAVILGLILASSVSTTWLGARGLGAVIRQLLGRQIETTLDSVTSRVEDLFKPSDRLLQIFEKRIRAGTLPLSDPIKVAGAFAEALEFEGGIKWIYFGYADGRLAGALVDQGQIILTVSSPDTLWQEWKSTSEGKLEPFRSDSMPQSFDARERNWFQLARDQTGIVWTPPYDYVAGQGRGLTVSQAVRSADGTLLGVVGVDILLKDVTEYLKHLKNDYQGDTLVFSLHGQTLASPKDQGSDPIVEIIREKLLAPGAWEQVRRQGGHLVMDFSYQGESYIAGVRSAVVPGNLDCVSAIVFSRKEAFGALEKTIFHSILTAIVALGAALLLGFLIAGRIATPLRGLAASVARIGRFDLGPHPIPHSTIREIRALSDAIEIMRSGLQSFSRYVPVDLVRNLVQSGGVADLGGERRDIAIMFCDLAGFTAYAESTDPEQAVKTLSGFFEDYGSAIDANSG
ncbi:MAG: HAMP domain-containing protein, partial [Terrimicrobiaceae bacterium]